MTGRHLWILFFVGAVSCILYTLTCSKSSQLTAWDTEIQGETGLFELRSGDILVRSNWGWLPGSCDIASGRIYGHVAIVTEGAKGNTADEALDKAMVVEALIFDQATRKFQFHKKDQIRNCKASISFGPRFKGIRYRLRMRLMESQVAAIRQFLASQLQGGYNLFSLKKQFGSGIERQYALSHMKPDSWNCALLAWEAFYLATGIDLDANHGLAIYPNDIIASNNFDLPDGRIRF